MVFSGECESYQHLSGCEYPGWVKKQFKRKPRRLYRDALLHASLIEGILIRESSAGTFHSANKELLCRGRTNRFDFCIFDEIKRIRNRLVHKIFKNSLDEKQIKGLRNELMDNICEAYKGSCFLQGALFEKYDIERDKCELPFTPRDK